jgi:hypothetical protein
MLEFTPPRFAPEVMNDADALGDEIPVIGAVVMVRIVMPTFVAVAVMVAVPPLTVQGPMTAEIHNAFEYVTVH